MSQHIKSAHKLFITHPPVTHSQFLKCYIYFLTHLTRRLYAASADIIWVHAAKMVAISSHEYWTPSVVVRNRLFRSLCVFILLTIFSPNREKLPSINDEDSRSSVGVSTCPAALTTSSVTSVVAAATSLPGDGAAGASSPTYAVTPVDHDYVKRKSVQQRHRRGQELQQQQPQQQQQQQDGTVPGPEYNSLTHSCTGG